jgi:hypothetical protein
VPMNIHRRPPGLCENDYVQLPISNHQLPRSVGSWNLEVGSWSESASRRSVLESAPT